MDLKYSIHKIDEEIVKRLSIRKYENPLDELDDVFKLYQELLFEHNVTYTNGENFHLNRTPSYERITKNCSDIKKIFSLYMNGDLIGCNNILSKLFKNTANSSTRQTLFPVRTLSKDLIWYRVRSNEDMRDMKYGDLFHVPFNKRENVTTKRYSIPGYPCLYMANSIVCCYKEIGFGKAISVSAFKLKEDIDVYDFTFFPEEDRDPKNFWSHLEAYPFKIACSLLVREQGSNSALVPEYIIPQFILHCTIRQKKSKKDGILYTSTKAYLENANETIIKTHTNLVVPVKSIKEKGYCNKLQKLFAMTKPRNIDVMALLNNDMFELETVNEFNNINLED